MMSVFPGERHRQAQNKSRFDLAKNPLKCNRRQMMALIHNDMAALCNEIFHCTLSVQTLDYGNIQSSEFGSPSWPGELHPEPLTDPDLNLSIHPARATP